MSMQQRSGSPPNCIVSDVKSKQFKSDLPMSWLLRQNTAFPCGQGQEQSLAGGHWLNRA